MKTKIVSPFAIANTITLMVYSSTLEFENGNRFADNGMKIDGVTVRFEMPGTDLTVVGLDEDAPKLRQPNEAELIIPSTRLAARLGLMDAAPNSLEGGKVYGFSVLTNPDVRKITKGLGLRVVPTKLLMLKGINFSVEGFVERCEEMLGTKLTHMVFKANEGANADAVVMAEVGSLDKDTTLVGVTSSDDNHRAREFAPSVVQPYMPFEKELRVTVVNPYFLNKEYEIQDLMTVSNTGVAEVNGIKFGNVMGRPLDYHADSKSFTVESGDEDGRVFAVDRAIQTALMEIALWTGVDMTAFDIGFYGNQWWIIELQHYGSRMNMSYSFVKKLVEAEITMNYNRFFNK